MVAKKTVTDIQAQIEALEAEKKALSDDLKMKLAKRLIGLSVVAETGTKISILDDPEIKIFLAELKLAAPKEFRKPRGYKVKVGENEAVE